MTAPQGRFITLEGGEGVGKSTQAQRLADAIRARGHEVVVTREPGGTPGAEAIRELLMTGEVDRWDARAEAALFAAARADHIRRIILPALNAGQWVVCDRFIDSTRAYQGAAGRMSDDEIVELHRIVCDNFMPDRTLLLSMPVFDASFRVFSRDGYRADRFASREGQYFDVVAAAFEQFAASEPHRIRRVDADGEPDTVTQRLVTAIEDLL